MARHDHAMDRGVLPRTSASRVSRSLAASVTKCKQGLERALAEAPRLGVRTHASWLNMVEIEIGILSAQGLDRRMPDLPVLTAEVQTWLHADPAHVPGLHDRRRVVPRHLRPQRRGRPDPLDVWH